MTLLAARKGKMHFNFDKRIFHQLCPSFFKWRKSTYNLHLFQNGWMRNLIVDSIVQGTWRITRLDVVKQKYQWKVKKGNYKSMNYSFFHNSRWKDSFKYTIISLCLNWNSALCSVILQMYWRKYPKWQLLTNNPMHCIAAIGLRHYLQ